MQSTRLRVGKKRRYLYQQLRVRAIKKISFHLRDFYLYQNLAKKVSLEELLKRIDDGEEEEVSSAGFPPSVAAPITSFLSMPGGPVGKLATPRTPSFTSTSITNFLTPAKKPAEKEKESKLVEQSDPIIIDSDEENDEVSTLFTIPGHKESKDIKAPPLELGEPLVLQKEPLVQVPAFVNAKLRDYQREGVKVRSNFPLNIL